MKNKVERYFIVGCPRSGTTLLQSLLAAHPEICSFPETHFFPNTMGKGWRRSLGIASPKAGQSLLKFLEVIDKEDMKDLVPKYGFLIRNYVHTFVSMLDELTRRQDKRIWIEKTPGHLHYIDVITKHIPDVRFIHIIRDGKDVVASLYEVTHKYPEVWGGARSIDQCIDRWKNDLRISFHYLHNRNHMIVRYEELVERPQSILKEVCNFIGISFDEAMIRKHHLTAQRVVSEGELWKSSVEEPIRNMNSQKFFEVFTEQQRQYILDRLSPTMINSRMKVLFLPDGSQGNPYQRELARALERHDVHVTLGNGVSRLPILGALKAYGKPDILHLHWTHGFVVAGSSAKTIIKAFRFLVELFIVRLLGIKIVWTVHNLLEHERRHPWLELFFNRILIRFYDQLIVHCSFAQEAVIQAYHLPDRFKNKINVIPHGHYIDSYVNHLSREQARAKLELDGKKIVFLYFGQIRPYKGVQQLVEAFRKLKSAQARLLIVGRPANEAIGAEVMRHCRSDNRICTFLQFIPDEEVQLYMNAADVVVLPYQDILTSGGALLAMSFGKAVIIPDIGCVPEVLDSRGGFLYDSNEEEGLLKAMERALKADLATMGQHNFDRAKHLDWDGIAQKTVEVYRRCQ